MQEIEHTVGRDDKQPVRLAVHGSELGDELGGRDPYRAGDAELVADLAPDQPADGGGRAEPPDRTGDVQERLIEGERLNRGSYRLKNGHDLARYRAVERVPRRHKHGMRAQALRPADRHGGAHAEAARDVVRRQDHPAATRMSDNDRLRPDLRPIPDLDAGVE